MRGSPRAAHPPEGEQAPPGGRSRPSDLLTTPLDVGCACWTCLEVATICGPAVLLALSGRLHGAGLWLGSSAALSVAVGWLARRR